MPRLRYTALRRFHHPRGVLDQTLIAARQFLERAQLEESMIDTGQRSQAQQFGQAMGIDPIVLVPARSRALRRGSQTTTFSTCGESRSCNQPE